MSTPHLDGQQERIEARARMIVAIQATAEVMGGRKLTDAAAGVLAERAARNEDLGMAALTWLGENDDGTLTLRKLIKAMTSLGPQFKQEHKAGGGCAANGCPMAGTMTTGGPMHCRYHMTDIYGTVADEITTVLRKNLEEIQVMTALYSDPSFEAWTHREALDRAIGDEVGRVIAKHEKKAAESGSTVSTISMVNLRHAADLLAEKRKQQERR